MSDVLERACAKLGVSPEQVLKHRLEGDSLVLVVDNGIAGCPKFTIPLSDLPEPQAEQPKEENNDAITSSARRSNRGRRGKDD